MEGRFDNEVHGSRFASDISYMIAQAKEIDRARCASYYREWVEHTGETHSPSSWQDVCTTNRFDIPWTAASINKALNEHAPHLVFCVEERHSFYINPGGVVRLKPEAVLPK
jgi:hypothetical protein